MLVNFQKENFGAKRGIIKEYFVLGHWGAYIFSKSFKLDIECKL